VIDAYTIGIRLALDDGVSAGIAKVQMELDVLDNAIARSSIGLKHLAEIGHAVASAGVSPAIPSPAPNKKPQSVEPASAGAPEPQLSKAPKPASSSAPIGTIPKLRDKPQIVEKPARSEASRPAAPAAPAPQKTESKATQAQPVPLRHFATEIAIQPASPENPEPHLAAILASPTPAKKLEEGAEGIKKLKEPLRTGQHAAPIERQSVPLEPQAAPTQLKTHFSRTDTLPTPYSNFVTEASPILSAPLKPVVKVHEEQLSRERVSSYPDLTNTKGEAVGSPPAPPAAVSGELVLDGMRLGHWLADTLASAASRPPRGITGFDPRATPAWPGRLGD
jgi:hypothetical protein